jgi:hypothetical protein
MLPSRFRAPAKMSQILIQGLSRRQGPGRSAAPADKSLSIPANPLLYGWMITAMGLTGGKCSKRFMLEDSLLALDAQFEFKVR